MSSRRWRSWLLWSAAVVLAAAAAADWLRPPERQVSVRLYEQLVISPYQRFAAPMTRRFVRCRFRPTCSQYSWQAVQVHGFPRGIWLTTARIFRCMPWVPAGTRDPVPPRSRPAAVHHG